MSSLSFLNAQKELAGQIGLDYTDTNVATRLKRWLNLAYHDIEGNYRWSWLKSRDVVTTQIDYDQDTDTTTVAIASGGTTATFSAGPAASQTNRYIQFDSADDWYLITAHTAAATTATISPAYAGTSALTASDFTIRTIYYSLGSDVEYIESGRQAITNEPIKIIDARDYDDKLAFPEDTGDPTFIALWGQDSNGYWQFTPYPYPDAAMLLEFRTIKQVTELSGDSDTALFPDRFNSVWLYGAKSYGYEFMDDDRTDSTFLKFEKQIKTMKTKDNPGANQFRRLAMNDGQPATEGAKMPPEFERNV